jgi:hypothetical protein
MNPPTGANSDALARRVRNEYLEMPGLSLTIGQAQRLWQLPRADCEKLLDMLVHAGFLMQTRAGHFVRA